MDLVVKWQELMNNPFFQDVPYKVELNKFGQILMSPASNRHGILKFKVAKEIERKKKVGTIDFNSSVSTNKGVSVAGIAWLSDDFFAEFGETTPFPKAPEICVEVKSPANSKAEMDEKIRLYLEKGALEVWIVDEYAKVSFHSHTGKLETSKLVKNFNL